MSVTDGFLFLTLSYSVIFVVLFALWRGDQVKACFQFLNVKLFLSYRRNRRE